MPIKAITGTPGAGKTLSALEELSKAVGVDPRKCKDADELVDKLRNRENPRPVFVCNVEGLKEGLFDRLEDPLEWQDCPDGSLILVDEVWQFLGTQLKAKDDPRVLELAKHRHRGFDFIFTLQQPSQLTSFVRGLVGEHVHVSRKFGTEMTERFTWPAMCDDPNSLYQRKRGSSAPWTYPKQVMGLYQSATIHTVKRKLPLRVLALPLLAVVLVGAVVMGALKIKGFVMPAEVAAGEAAQRSEHAPPPSPPGQVQPASEVLTAAQWLERHTPRVSTMPWSAPLYDNRPAIADPRVFCMVAGEGEDEDCECRTEQGTRYTVTFAECRFLAYNGEPYNPYRQHGRILTTDSGRPSEGRSLGPGGGLLADEVGRPGSVSMGAPQVSGYGDLGITANPGP